MLEFNTKDRINIIVIGSDSNHYKKSCDRKFYNYMVRKYIKNLTFNSEPLIFTQHFVDESLNEYVKLNNN